ncbi:hypothetical protein MRX96_026327 [Rhipicephalus microplus]
MIFVATNSSKVNPAPRRPQRRRKIRVRVKNTDTTSGYPSGESADEQTQPQRSGARRGSRRPSLTKRITLSRTRRPARGGVPTDKGYEVDRDQHSREPATTSAPSDVQPPGQSVNSKAYTGPAFKELNGTVVSSEQNEASKKQVRLPPIDSFDEEYDHDYEHAAGQRASNISLTQHTNDRSLLGSFIPKIGS